jgi:hypothetical protein
MKLQICGSALVLALCALSTQAAPVSLTTPGSTYLQQFNSQIAFSGSTGSTLPAGWTFLEAGTGANATYGVSDGATNSGSTGNTYSLGAGNVTERALGMLRGDAFASTIGANFRNDTGETIVSLDVGYIGELWRLGADGRVDRIDFQFSTDATSLADGRWADVDALDFSTPATVTAGPGAKVGNNAANRTSLSATIGGLNIAPGAEFWVRWTDFDADGADDSLGVDDFSLTPTVGAASAVPAPSAAVAGLGLLGAVVVRRRMRRAL